MEFFQKQIKNELLFKYNNWNLGQLSRSKETLLNISNSLKGKFYINNNNIQIYVLPEEADKLYSFGFIKGKLSKK